MAYDPNFPFGYTPYYQQRPQTSTYAFVNGLEGAKRYPLSSNQSMLLMDSEQSVCYLKQANALGQTSLKCFKLVEVNETDLSVPNDKQAQDLSNSFVKNEDFVTLKNRLDEIEKKLGEQHG